MRSGHRLNNRAGVRQCPAPTVQLTWTRLGRAMGVTQSATARDEIGAAAEQMRWVKPHELRLLNQAPARSVVAGIFFGRRDELRRAGVAALASGGAGRRLIGLEDADGSRYFLVHDRCRAEVVYVLLVSPVGGAAA